MPFIAIFLISFALLIDEIMLSAIFHVSLGAGNTVTAISIALIGLSAGGIFAYSAPSLNDPTRAAATYPKLLFWFSASLLASAFLIIRVPLGHGDLIYTRGNFAIQLWRLAVYHIAVIPFFLGGLTIAVLLRSYVAKVSRLYFFDLAGAAMGCAVSPLLLSALGAPAAILWGAAPAAGVAIWLVLRERVLPRALVLIPLAMLLLGVLKPSVGTFPTLNTMGRVNDPTYRSFAIEAGDLELEKWALDAWTIIRGDHIPQQWEEFDGWGLSKNYRGPVPDITLVNYNARFSTYITEFDGDFDEIAPWLDADLTSLHYQLGRRYESVLNIGAGGGREVLSALQHGATHVVAVDISDVVVEDIMKGHLRDFSGDLFLDHRVTAVADEGRTYSERSRERFDVIDFSIVGGANLEKMDLVRVDDLFTREALGTYVRRMSDDGLFSYVMYSTRSDIVTDLAEPGQPVTQPYIPALRTLTGLRMALEDANPSLRFADHVLIAALPGVISPSYDLVHIIASVSPFSAAERDRFVELCRQYEFTLLYPRPDASAAPDPYVRVIEAEDLGELARELPFSISPTTDDRPFQYSFEWNQFSKALERGGLWTLLSENAFISLGVSIGALAVVVTLIPLVVIRVRTGSGPRVLRRSWRLMLYFACIGYAYMAVEIAALLRLQSYLGKPIYGLSVALFAFLLFSGIGSYLTSKLPAARLSQSVYVIVALIGLLGAGFVWIAGPLFASTIHLPVAQRALIAVVAVFPLALPMGMLFPIGVKLIARENADLIPWAWAINGCVSVLGIFGTRITALFLGFNRALLVGLLVYALVAACVYAHTRKAPLTTPVAA